MRTIFEVTDPASPNVLLTTAEARAAVGITDGSRDTDLDNLVRRISASIFRATKVRTDGINPPTLLSEELTDTFRLECHMNGALLLSRRRVTEITTLTEGVTELTEGTDFTADKASGELFRLGSTDEQNCWPQGTIVVDYVAGFEDVPDDLKLAAEIWLRALWRDSYGTPAVINDPFTKVEDIPGVRRIERWIPTMNTQTVTMIPPEVEAILYDGGYIETWVA